MQEVEQRMEQLPSMRSPTKLEGCLNAEASSPADKYQAGRPLGFLDLNVSHRTKLKLIDAKKCQFFDGVKCNHEGIN